MLIRGQRALRHHSSEVPHLAAENPIGRSSPRETNRESRRPIRRPRAPAGAAGPRKLCGAPLGLMSPPLRWSRLGTADSGADSARRAGCQAASTRCLSSGGGRGSQSRFPHRLAALTFVAGDFWVIWLSWAVDSGAQTRSSGHWSIPQSVSCICGPKHGMNFNFKKTLSVVLIRLSTWPWRRCCACFSWTSSHSESLFKHSFYLQIQILKTIRKWPNEILSLGTTDFIETAVGAHLVLINFILKNFI